jgi:hypothetical protein
LFYFNLFSTGVSTTERMSGTVVAAIAAVLLPISTELLMATSNGGDDGGTQGSEKKGQIKGTKNRERSRFAVHQLFKECDGLSHMI